MKATVLPDRGVIKVAGDETRTFLNGLLTADITQVTPQSARFAALLTPQGKIVVDCIVAEGAEGLFLDCPRTLAASLVEKLKFYKLRAKVAIEDLSSSLVVLAIWGGSGNTTHGLTYADPRLAALGRRIILPAGLVPQATADLGAQLTDASAYEANRIALGVPRGGLDFAYGDAFPHEADMDQLNGVDFAKGCYVGQEVVSRMEHRGTARNRVVPVTTDGNAPGVGLPVMANDKQVGLTGSAIGSHGLAMLRLDRVADANAAGLPLIAGGVTIHPRKPDWARFDWPGEKAAG
jgi:folate-binding protein YgfZ